MKNLLIAAGVATFVTLSAFAAPVARAGPCDGPGGANPQCFACIHADIASGGSGTSCHGGTSDPGLANLQACLAAKAMGGDVHGMC
jgi:uncharacterized membrane protein